MKTLVIVALLLVLLVVPSQPKEYVHLSTLSVTTAKVDTTFTKADARLYEMSFWFTGCAGWLQVASHGDTTGLASRDSLKLADGAVIAFDKDSNIHRIIYWADSGSGTLSLAGKTKEDHQ